MAYYNRDGKILNVRDKKMQYLTSGENAQVFYNDDIIFKEYFSESECRLKPKMFDILKTVNNKHFIELYEIYSDFDIKELCEYKTNKREFIVDAYTAKYYSDDSVNPLYESTDYILDNFYELGLLFDLFTDNLIVVNDVKRENTRLSREGIVIIDPDSFSKEEPEKDIRPILGKDIISTMNKRELLALFRKICISSLKVLENYEEMRKRIILDLANIIVYDTTDVAYEISKKLRNYKRPIDYFTI